MLLLRLIILLCLLGLPLLLSAQESPAVPPNGQSLVAAARAQIGKTLTYDPAYTSLPYPGGDVPLERGVCSDVVIRTLRGVKVDLQKLVHEDMKAHFSVYPKIWGLKKPDPNIDHRRVPNLAKYFQRQGKSLPVSSKPGDWLPGDFVVCRLSNGLIHIMVVSDKTSPGGTPLVIHNIGAGAREEDALFAFKIEGRYRWFPAKQSP